MLPTNLKAGLLNNVDLQVVLTPYAEQSGDGPGASGFGDTQLRLKVNLWGNDAGATALAVMPYVQIPTGDDAFSSGDTEGGVIVPLLIGLPDNAALTVMAELDFVRDSRDAGYELQFLHTASYGRDLSGRVGGYVEYIGLLPEGGGDYAAAAGTGLMYAVNDDVQLDAGVTVGLNEAADDLRVFAGVSFRL